MKNLLVLVFVATVFTAYGQTESNVTLIEIEDTSVQPYNKICYQYIKRNKILSWGGWKQSTGFFIDRNFILTAAHNVHSQFLSNVQEINIKIGRRGDDQLHETITISGKDLVIKHVKTPDQYGMGKGFGTKVLYDFALIYIPDNLLPNDFVWENEFVLPASTVSSEEVTKVAGYPANYDRGYDGSQLFYQDGDITRARNSYTHKFETAGGNSGSPVWVTVDDQNLVIGIHTFSGSGTLIDGDNLQTIRDWMASFKDTD